MADYTESFNKADGTILGPDLAWTELSGTWEIASNMARDTGAGGTNLARADQDLAGSAQYAEVTVGLVAGNFAGVWLRVVDTNNGYMLRCNAGTWQIYKKSGGGFTLLNSAAGGTISNGDVIRGEVTAAHEFTIKQNGVTRLTHTDASPQSTGLRTGMVAGGSRYDSFAMGDLGGGGGSSGNPWYYYSQQ